MDEPLAFSIWADCEGKTTFPIFRGDEPTGEMASYLQCLADGKWYRVSFDPSTESPKDVMPRLNQLLKEMGVFNG